MSKVCSVEDCGTSHKAKGFCERHYYLYRKNGVPVPKRIRGNDTKRFWLYVNKSDSCWDWIGFTQKGYGCFRVGAKILRAHRYSYELHGGKFVDGMVLDHTCNNKKCVNPQHLEQVTNPENTRRHYARLNGDSNDVFIQS
jgi:hypothetical protein